MTPDSGRHPAGPEIVEELAPDDAPARVSFTWRSALPASVAAPAIELAFTNRGAERGDDPYAGFNLGDHVGDDPVAVERRRRLLASSLGVPRGSLVFMQQVHGASVLDVKQPWVGPAPDGDAVVTRTPGVALAVLVADCVPVLLHDAAAGVVGAVHAGRAGLVKGVVPAAVRRMRELGADAISAVVGPSICGRCYELPGEVVAAVAASSPVSATRSWTGTPAVDVAAGIVDQLVSHDVSVEWLAGCTREDEQLYSYRRQGRTGRFAGVIMIREEAQRG